jgi:hypothetical protein
MAGLLFLLLSPFVIIGLSTLTPLPLPVFVLLIIPVFVVVADWVQP